MEAAVDRWGRFDILIDNAGACVGMPLEAVRAQSIEDIIAVNVTAPSTLAHAALPQLIEHQGTTHRVRSTTAGVRGDGHKSHRCPVFAGDDDREEIQ